MALDSILTPVLALISWSLIVLVWLYSTRIPATLKAKVKFDKNMTKEKYAALMPFHARNIADNYNHLMEQPTLFYALVAYLKLSGYDTPLQVKLAWAYVVLRIVHTFAQRVGIIMIRFNIFVLASLALYAMAGLAWLQVLS